MARDEQFIVLNISFIFQETTVLIVNEQETGIRDSAVLEKVELIMKNFPQATFDDVLRSPFDRNRYRQGI